MPLLFYYLTVSFLFRLGRQIFLYNYLDKAESNGLAYLQL